MDIPTQQSGKEAVGLHAAGLVEDGMQVGLGTGSTTAFAIREIGRRIREEGLRIVGIPTSFAAEHLGRQAGIPMSTLDGIEGLDIALDGADEVDPALDLIKGRGAAHTRERIVASLADRFIVLVDAPKLVAQLGLNKPVPVEVLPMAVFPVMRALADLGAEPVIRMGTNKDGPVVTDQGFWVVDAQFNGIEDAGATGAAIRALPGVLDHGLFVGMAHIVLVGEEGGGVRALRRRR